VGLLEVGYGSNLLGFLVWFGVVDVFIFFRFGLLFCVVNKVKSKF